MTDPLLTIQVRYVTNETGEPTDVLVPFALWEKVVAALKDSSSGLAWVDEYEPNAQILADLKTSLQQAAQRDVLPVSELWNDL
ncbi:MAG: hypothetical protein AAFY33_18995 [Cyanobacteria bacterium J06643_4]